MCGGWHEVVGLGRVWGKQLGVGLKSGRGNCGWCNVGFGLV